MIHKKKCSNCSSFQIEDVQLLQHHWEQPYVDSSESGFPLRQQQQFNGGGLTATSYAGTHQLQPLAHSASNASNESSVSFASHTAHAHGNFEGFFRFRIGTSVFRLMLLSKDRQNLLKIYSFDFLLVGMQVTTSHGALDEHIWEFEWKRLDRHGKKAVAPVILLGYFRDVLKLNGAGDVVTLKRTIDESRVNVQKAGKRHRAIPRFCDFVTGNSTQVEALFRDIRCLYKNPGFVLQQCAYINNVSHFTKIIENPHLCEEDLQYECENGDNPIMIAAKLRHLSKKTRSWYLSFLRPCH